MTGYGRAEERIQKWDAVIAEYRKAIASGVTEEQRQELAKKAINDLRKLGLDTGDAIRYLFPDKRR